MPYHVRRCCRLIQEQPVRTEEVFVFSAAHLVDGEADGLHVFALPSLFPAVLLHEANQEAALGVSRRVGMLQHQLELGVEPEGGWKTKTQRSSSSCNSGGRRQGQRGLQGSWKSTFSNKSHGVILHRLFFSTFSYQHVTSFHL